MYLFAFGSLLDPERQQHVLGRNEEGIPDTLEGYKKSWLIIDGYKYATLHKAKKEFVDGAIIEVSQKDLELIDLYEEPEFSRRKVTLKSGTTAWIYTANEEHKKEGAWV